VADRGREVDDRHVHTRCDGVQDAGGHHQVRLLAGVAAAALLLTSCASGNGPATTPSPSPTGTSAGDSGPPALTPERPPPSTSSASATTQASTPTTPYPNSPGPGVQTVGYDDNGKTVTINAGEAVHVELDSTYWTIRGSSAVSVLAPAGPAVHVGQGS